MFQVLAPVTLHPSTEARQALGAGLHAAGRAAWHAIARSGLGLEFAHLPFRFADTGLALSSRLRADGVIVIEVGLDDGRHPGRVVTAARFRAAAAHARAKGR